MTDNERRSRAERTIGDIFGSPGTGHDTEIGRRLLMEMLEARGLDALTDDAVAELAAKHLEEDERPRFSL